MVTLLEEDNFILIEVYITNEQSIPRLETRNHR